VVSNEIAVSGDEATLRLEFKDNHRFEISLRNGQVLIDDETTGTYVRGDALDTAWRSLLGQVVALEDGPLAEALRSWEPPEDLSDVSEELAAAMDEAIKAALEPIAALQEVQESEGTTLETILDTAMERSVLQALLLGQTDRLGILGEALEDVTPEQIRVYVGEDVVVESGEEVDATLVVVDGELDVEGTVRGDIVVAGGSLRIRDGSRVTGDVRLADSRLFRDGGTVEGRVRNVEEERAGVEELRDQLRQELEHELESVTAERIRREFERERRSSFHPLRHIGSGLAGILQNLFTFLILAAIGIGIVHFAGENLSVVASAARHAPGRSAMVGLAGAFLALPVWVLGMVVLAVSLIGIPVLVVWIPLFPLAVAAAAGLGYMAVAKNVGRWLADQHYQGLEWLDGRNPRQAVIAGIGALMAACVAANVVQMAGPWLGFLQGLFAMLGVMAGIAAVTVGFGAVILTRGGRRSDLAYAEDLNFRDTMWTGWTRSRDRASSSGVEEVEVEVKEAAEEVEEAAAEIEMEAEVEEAEGIADEPESEWWEEHDDEAEEKDDA
jgi:cytoskeletal protein CcmA (bactofilin family)